MFQGTGKKEFHCRRCMLKDARRRFLNGEDFVRVQFREINANSRSSSPHPYLRGSNNDAGVQQENRTPQHSQTLEDTSMEVKFSCKRCLKHHRAYRKMERPQPQPVVLKREESRNRGNAPRKTRRASPKGIWTAASLRGLNMGSPTITGGRHVPSASQQFSDTWQEEHLSLRFSDSPLTDCIRCLEHHGFDTSKYKCMVQPDQDLYHQLGHGLSSSKGNPEAEGSSPKSNIGELGQNENDVAWWAKSEEECGCKRCSLHHMNHEELLKFSEQRRNTEDERKGRRPMGTSNYSSPRFATPNQEFSRSRTPTPQRSYRGLYERKLQGEDTSNRHNTFELHQLWKPPKKLPKNDDNHKAQSQTAWDVHRVKPTRRAWQEGSSQHNKIQGENGTLLRMKHGKSRTRSPSKSPKWSKECLHKRELWRTNKRAIERTTMKEKRARPAIKLYGKLVIGRTHSLPRGQGNKNTGIACKSQAPAKAPNLTKDRKLMRSMSPHQNDKRAMVLEEKEARWAPPPKWTVGEVSIKGAAGRRISPKKNVMDRESLPTNFRDQKENLNTNMNLTDASRTNIKTPKVSPARMLAKGTSSKGRMRQSHSPHDDKTSLDCKFEVINIETKEFEERNPNGSVPDLCASTQKSDPTPKQIFLRIPKSRQKNNNDKDKKAGTSMPSPKTKEKCEMAKEKSDRDMKLRVEIKSELPLDVVDGSLKQFLKGVGGLVYYSQKDGGIPRIKELTSYFSGKQPLLWFFPRST